MSTKRIGKHTVTLKFEVELTDLELCPHDDLIYAFNGHHFLNEEWLRKYSQEEMGGLFVSTGNANLLFGKLIQTKVQSNKRPGFVYFILSAHGVKIGRAKKPIARAKKIIASLPFSAKIFGTVKTDDMVELEADLHDLFQEQRLGGEWFEISRSDIREATAGRHLALVHPPESDERS